MSVINLAILVSVWAGVILHITPNLQGCKSDDNHLSGHIRYGTSQVKCSQHDDSLAVVQRQEIYLSHCLAACFCCIVLDCHA